MRAVVAMSGGVDSSVAAALLKEQGYEVIGVTMQLWPAPEAEGFGGCCGLDAITDAKRVAHTLGIPHYVLNFREVFGERVIANFCHEYSLGRTPNPCIRCNQYIKFDALLQKARGLDADFIATGHYSRIEYDQGSGGYQLKGGVDLSKDQSYVLYMMSQEQLRQTLMPLGHLTKERVREIAQELGLPVADKGESQEICFIPDDDYPRFLGKHLPQAMQPGPILDRQGNVLGQHRGLLFYTIGQRRRLGLCAGEPLYVVAIDPGRNAIIVGSKEMGYREELIANEVHWVAGEPLTQPLAVKAKIRYRHQGAQATVTPLAEDKVRVRFQVPQWAPTPGQAVVFYNGDSVLGGGTIDTVAG